MFSSSLTVWICECSDVSRNPQLVREILKFAAEKPKGGRGENDEESDDEFENEDAAGKFDAFLLLV
jgi:hypothetical protein